MNVHSSVLGLIGKTPLVKLNAIAHDIPATIYVKLESRNPGGSVKDRIGIAMLETVVQLSLRHIQIVELQMKLIPRI